MFQQKITKITLLLLTKINLIQCELGKHCFNLVLIWLSHKENQSVHGAYCHKKCSKYYEPKAHFVQMQECMIAGLLFAQTAILAQTICIVMHSHVYVYWDNLTMHIHCTLCTHFCVYNTCAMYMHFNFPTNTSSHPMDLEGQFLCQPMYGSGQAAK